MNVELSDKELSLLLQSLTHCLSTCKNAGKAEPCEDCDAASALKNKLLKQQGATKEK